MERFASLQAAHRALCHSVHPSQLESVRGESRALLILLQTHSTQLQSGDQKAATKTSLEDIDRGLFEQTEHTLEVLGRIGLAQLRATIPTLSEQHPDEVRGLIDLLLSGDLHSDKNLRMLEYLITVMSTRDSDGRRVVVTKPCEVTSRLAELTAEQFSIATEDCLVAERVLENATAKALQGGELGATRDRVRHYKEQLGRDVLHPRVLAAVVAYNVAMWNEVASEIESSRSIDQLTEDLLVTAAETELLSARIAPACEVLGSTVFASLVRTLDARISGRASGDDPMSQLVAELDLKTLRVEDVELFGGSQPDGTGEAGAGEEGDEALWLMRAAVALGLVLRDREALEQRLVALSLEPKVLEGECVRDLAKQISELARKRFAASNYNTAFKLSDVKTHSLAPHLSADMRRVVQSVGAIPAPAQRSSGSTVKFVQLLRGLPPWPVILSVLMVIAVLAVPTIATRTRDGSNDGVDVAQISPDLVHGRYMGQGAARIFVGRVAESWYYMDTDERRRLVSEIGTHFADEGIKRVVLEGARRKIVAEFEDGRVLYLLNRVPGQSIGD